MLLLWLSAYSVLGILNVFGVILLNKRLVTLYRFSFQFSNLLYGCSLKVSFAMREGTYFFSQMEATTYCNLLSVIIPVWLNGRRFRFIIIYRIWAIMAVTAVDQQTIVQKIRFHLFPHKVHCNRLWYLVCDKVKNIMRKKRKWKISSHFNHNVLVGLHECHHGDCRCCVAEWMPATTLIATAESSYALYALRLVHYNDVIMSAMACQVTSLTIVYPTVYSRCRSQKTSKLRVTGLCEENSPVTDEFPAQRASNVENVSIWWVMMFCSVCFTTQIASNDKSNLGLLKSCRKWYDSLAEAIC